MADAVVRVQSSRVVITLGGGEVVAFQAAQAAAPFADRAEAALAQIEEIASGAPDAPSVFAKADRNANLSDLTDPAAARFNIGADLSQNVNFNLGAAGAVSRTLAQRAVETISVRDFGAKGDNVTDDTPAFVAMINWANAQTFPQRLYVPPGQYRCTSAWPAMSRGHVIVGAGARCSIIVFSGNYDCITFKGVSARVSGGGIENLGFFLSGMTGGNFLTIDWAQNMTLRSCYINAPYNFAYIRQAGNTLFDSLDIQEIGGQYGGQYGVKWYGDGSTRNGEEDRSDVFDLRSCVLDGNHRPGVSNGTADLLWLDGYVQTLNFHRLQLLSSKRAIVTSNSPGLPYPKIPSFILGSDLEIEQAWKEGIYAPFLNTMNVSGFFIASSNSESGAYLGPFASNISLTGGRFNSNWKHGLHIDGACNISLMACVSFDNSEYSSGAFDGVHISSGTTIALIGGTFGKPAGSGGYTEHQGYGVNNIDGARVLASAVDFTGNVTAATSGTITKAACVP